MGRINKKTCSMPGLAVMLSSLICLLVIAAGCSSVSWVINHNSSSDDLLITEADVDAMITELSLAQPADSETILYNETADRYELTPDAYRKAPDASQAIFPPRQGRPAVDDIKEHLGECQGQEGEVDASFPHQEKADHAPQSHNHQDP